MQHSFRRTAVSAGLALVFSGACAQQSPAALGEIVIQGRREDLEGTAGSASEGVVTRKQLRSFTHERVRKLLGVGK